MRPVDAKRFADVKKSVDTKGSADIEKPILADVEKHVVIFDKYLYLYQYVFLTRDEF